MNQRMIQKEESRARILASAGQGFRTGGYGGIGVDGLAKAAGVTSGAFYAHFKSKAEAFREAVRAGMTELRAGVEGFRARDGAAWRERFVDFYLGERRRAPLAESCALQSLTGEVARADAEARRVYTSELEAVIAAAGEKRAETIALLALLSGGVSMARAVDDEALAEEIAAAVRAASGGGTGGGLLPDVLV